MKLYSFFRSGTSHRLRIALNLKGLTYEQVAVDLRREEHLRDEYRSINPQQLVPALDVDGATMIQTPAIIEWLEERYPQAPLLPQDPLDRAHVRALAAIIGCDVHPVNNRRILEALRHRFGADQAAIDEWCSIWISSGFSAFEALLAARGSKHGFSFGDAPTIRRRLSHPPDRKCEAVQGGSGAVATSARDRRIVRETRRLSACCASGAA